jgi:hypothetical protein
VCRDLGLTPAGEGTLEGYFDVRREHHRRRAAAARRTRVVVGIARGLRCERRPRHEWLGAYPAARRRAAVPPPRTSPVPSARGAGAGPAAR